MRHWSQLGIRNWRVKPGRTAAAIGAIALGVGVVVWVTCAYESVRLALQDQAWFWIGRSDLTIESAYGPVGTVFESLVEKVQRIPNVKHVTCRLRQTVRFEPAAPSASTQPADLAGEKVELIGIDPQTESPFREYDAQRITGGGRMLRPEDAYAAVIEQKLAAKYGLGIGDRFVLRSSPPLDAPEGTIEKSATFTIVGLIEHRRVAMQQWPVVIATLDRVKSLAQFADDIPRVTRIDIILADQSIQAINKTAAEIRGIPDVFRQRFLVTSAESKRKQVAAAEKQTGLVLVLLSTVALFTGFFIILSTLSMGMVERVGQLGMLRCLGATRLQIAALVLSEALLMGLVGMVLGIPIGLGLDALSVRVAPEFVGTLAISKTGLALAMIGGVATTLLGAALPTLQAMRVSPLAASRPQSRPTPAILTWAALVIGLAMVAGHSLMIRYLPPPAWLLQPLYAVASIALLYGGYALLTPGLIRLLGGLVVLVAATVLRMRRQLLGDQVGRAAWRSAAICCGLMVGLSLIVSLVVHSKSLARGWDFPREFAEAFVVLERPIPWEHADRVRGIPGVGQSCLINESVRCTILGRGFFIFGNTTFIAGDPDEFFKIAKLEFVKGDKDQATARLKQGGAVLVTPEFTKSQRFDYGDKIPLQLKGSAGLVRSFEIVGVVTSPALDIAANYFNASGMLVQASVLVVLGTFDDVQRQFGLPREVSMFLINFDLPAGNPPPEFHADMPPALEDPARFRELLDRWRPALPERRAELERIDAELAAPAASSPSARPWSGTPMLRLFRQALLDSAAAKWSSLSPQQRWDAFREELVMQLVTAYSRAPGLAHGSVRALKQQIDRDLQRATILFASVPAVALIVAALGVANLMMANVASRSRQIAMLRAVGATRWQIIRLVVGEALVLGCLGSVIGLTIGLHGAAGLNHITTAIWGYEPEWTIPWDWVGLGIAFTMLVCLVAGLLPARYAARNNIIEALQAT